MEKGLKTKATFNLFIILSVFTRSKMNVTQPPKSLLYQEIKQGAEYFSPVQQERQLLNVDVKHYYVQIAQKNVCKSAL